MKRHGIKMTLPADDPMRAPHLLGPFVGAVLGELTAARTLQDASRAGFGATLGMALGAAAKLALGIAMVGVFAVMRFV